MTAAEAEFARSEFANAVNTFGCAIELTPNMAIAWAARGQARLAREDHSGAVTDFSEAIRLDPSFKQISSEVLLHRARVRGQLGEYVSSVEDFNSYLRLVPANATAICGRGLVKLKKGDRPAAVQDLGLAVRLGDSTAKALLRTAMSRSEAAVSAPRSQGAT